MTALFRPGLVSGQMGRRPAAPYAFNRDSPLADGLVGFWPLWFDHSDNDFDADNFAPYFTGPSGGTYGSWVGSNDGPVTVGVSDILGLAPTFGTGPNRRFSFSATNGPHNISPPCTIAAWIQPSTATVTSTILGSCNNPDNDTYLGIKVTSSGTVQAVHTDDAGTVGAATGGSYAANGVHLVVGRFLDSAYREIWQDGIFKQSDSTSVGTTTLNRSALGCTFRATVVENFTGMASDFCLWDRYLNDSEIWRLFAPETRWGFYWPLRNKVFSFPGGAAAASVASYLPLLGVG